MGLQANAALVHVGGLARHLGRTMQLKLEAAAWRTAQRQQSLGAARRGLHQTLNIKFKRTSGARRCGSDLHLSVSDNQTETAFV
jgi:hypothetical protein